MTAVAVLKLDQHSNFERSHSQHASKQERENEHTPVGNDSDVTMECLAEAQAWVNSFLGAFSELPVLALPLARDDGGPVGSIASV